MILLFERRFLFVTVHRVWKRALAPPISLHILKRFRKSKWLLVLGFFFKLTFGRQNSGAKMNCKTPTSMTSLSRMQIVWGAQKNVMHFCLHVEIFYNVILVCSINLYAKCEFCFCGIVLVCWHLLIPLWKLSTTGTMNSEEVPQGHNRISQHNVEQNVSYQTVSYWVNSYRIISYCIELHHIVSYQTV